jgi:hypothetical protein
MAIFRQADRPMLRLTAVPSFLALSLALAIFTSLHAPASAQDATTEGHPLVGTWMLMTEGDGASIATFSSDGTMVDAEASGEIGLGSWVATSPTSATATFAIFFLEPESGTAGTIVIRATLDYDAATDSVSVTHNATAADQFGTVLFSDDGLGSATRLTVEGPESGGASLPGLFVVPESTPPA